jgi:CDP-diacylglycerol--serine O-phosphatidyltransferase
MALARLVPNAMTLGAVCAGITSIRFSVSGQFEAAVALLVLAAFLDGLDGQVARALRGESPIGAELDSLADVVNFGVAPAILLYFFSLWQMPALGWGAALVYMICCTLRLARFNVRDRTSPNRGSGWFEGVPSPAGALLALAPVLIAQVLPGRDIPVLVTALWLVSVGVLMVSRIPTVSLKLRVPRRAAAFLLAGVAAAAVSTAAAPWHTLLCLVFLYLASLPLGPLLRRRGIVHPEE